ncbi:hypothetical protein PoB_007572900 [Plakobranchus ocellatus]|uniref:Uncharacterized protein n=1 Tax=Plakobranchus ocellatus TaxID=259542 RepID=A0AAV4DYE6_9GAST|nr:hypothetical protein PoB_007572900 [Plakobranchus ocellatus]
MTRKNFRKTFMKIHDAAQEIAEESMMKAAKEMMDFVLLLKLGVNVGAMSHKMCQAGDAQRQKDSACMSLGSTKKRRKTLRAKRKGFQDITRDEEEDVYSPECQ